jgi:hypothetical protein
MEIIDVDDIGDINVTITIPRKKKSSKQKEPKIVARKQPSRIRKQSKGKIQNIVKEIGESGANYLLSTIQGESAQKPAKKPFNFAICKRCHRRGHHRFDKETGKECNRVDDKDGFLLTMDPKERNKDNIRILREDIDEGYHFIPVWHEFNYDVIQNIKSNQAAIYEIAIVKDDIFEVMYLGMTSDIRDRLKDHHQGCRLVDGFRRESNIAREVKDAIKKGFKVVYRYTIQPNAIEAKKLESKLLDTYDYCWNIDENGKERRFIKY